MEKDINDICEQLSEICYDLCDAIGDSPCGCEACPYVETKDDNGTCKVHRIIMLKNQLKGE